MAKSGPRFKREELVIKRLVERWQDGQWVVYRNELPGDLDAKGRLSAGLQALGPMRTVTVRVHELVTTSHDTTQQGATA